MNVMIACEFTGAVRDAFRACGHSAWSCDLIPSEGDNTWHIQRDVLTLLDMKWDLMIAFPPCTHLAGSGARWWPMKQKQQAEALEFVRALMNAPIARIAIENPVGKISTAIRKPDQIIQPWQYGDGYVKTTCLWLKNLDKLVPDCIVPGREQACWMQAGWYDNQAHERSRTYPGIARAMAEQWGK